MARTLTLEVPLPTREQSPNAGGHYHWRAIGEAKKQAKAAAYWAGFSALREKQIDAPFSGIVTLSAEFYMSRKLTLLLHSYCPRDADNAIASLKATIDGFVQSGIIPGDAAKHLKVGDVKLYSTAKEHKGRSCVVITLTESETAA